MGICTLRAMRRTLLLALPAWLCTAVALAQEATEAAPSGLDAALKSIDEGFGAYLVTPLATVLFFDVAPGETTLPFIVLWLVLGASFFTVRFGFINLRAFKHAILVTMGRYDQPGAEGEDCDNK